MSEQSYKNTCFWSKDVDQLLVFKKIKTVSCNYYFTAGIFEQYSVLILKLPCCVKLPNSHNNQAEASLSFLTPVTLYYCYLQKNNLFDILETLRSLVRLKICFNFCCQGQIWYCLKMIYLQILTKIDGFFSDKRILASARMKNVMGVKTKRINHWQQRNWNKSKSTCMERAYFRKVCSIN